MEGANLAGAVVLSGLVIVFLVLVILIGVVLAVGRLTGAKPKQSSPLPAPVVEKPQKSAPPVVQEGIGEETVAVIAAAVAAVMEEQSPGVPYTVAGIQRARTARPVWGFAGMQQNTRPF